MRDLHVVSSREVVSIRRVLGGTSKRCPSLVKQRECASSWWPDSFGDMWREEASSEVASGLSIVIAMNRPFERILLHLLERRRVLVVGVSLSLYKLRMLVGWRSGLGESVALSLQGLHVLSSAKDRGGAIDEVGRWTPKDA